MTEDGLFNVKHPGQAVFTTVIAGTALQAQDRFCQRHGYRDLAHFCHANEHASSPLQVVVVREGRADKPEDLSAQLQRSQAQVEDLRQTLELVVERDFTFVGKDANTDAPASLWNAVRNGRAALARNKPAPAADVFQNNLDRVYGSCQHPDGHPLPAGQVSVFFQ